MTQEKCKVCNKNIQSNCDWNQGRCPHIPSLIKGSIMNHQNLSFLKSGFRLGACVCIAYYEFQAGAILLAIAELLGIVEELV